MRMPLRLVTSLALTACLWAIPRTALADNASDPVDAEPGSLEEIHVEKPTVLDELFQEADRYLSAVESQYAAGYSLREAAAYLDGVGYTAEPNRQDAILDLAETLRGYATDLTQRKSVDRDAVRRTFAQAHLELARHYEGEATALYARGAKARAGRQLQAATRHIQDALTWTDRRIEAARIEALEVALDAAEDLASGTEIEDDVVQEALQTVHDESQELATRLGEPAAR